MRTFGDQVAQLTDSLSIESSVERLNRLAKAAVRGCYADIASRHHWKYLLKRQQMNVIAPYSTGTVAYTASTRTLTLTSGTFPSWAASGVVLLNRNVYDVETRTDDTHLVLASGRAPTEDVAAGTAYTLSQINYDLPSDFVELRGITELERLWIVRYLYPEELLQRTQIWFQPSNIIYYTVVGGSNGLMQLQWAPPPSEARTFDLIYQARPRPFGLTTAYSTGTATVTASSNAVTISSGTLPTNIAGCVFRIGSTTEPPDGPNGDNPAVEEHIILERTGATTFTLEDTVTTSASGVRYIIDDPIDIETVSMMTYFDRMCEARTLRLHQSSPDRVAFADRAELDAFILARAADERLIPSLLAAQPTAQGLGDLLWGVQVEGP